MEKETKSDNPKKVKTLTKTIFGDKELSINDYEPDYKIIYRTLGLPDNYNEIIDPNAQ